MYDYHATPTIADSLNPKELAAIAQSFGLDMDESDYVSSDEPFITDEYLERHHGMVTSDHLWTTAWRFGIVIDNDTPLIAESLKGYWNPTGSLTSRAGYYVPDDYDTEIPLVSLDNPPKFISIADQEA